LNAPGVPADCFDYDSALWFAIREQTDGELPRQSLRRWGAEQAVRRSRDVLGPLPVDHERLLADLAWAWHPKRLAGVPR
jgi:hypothetical protein